MRLAVIIITLPHGCHCKVGCQPGVWTGWDKLLFSHKVTQKLMKHLIEFGVYKILKTKSNKNYFNCCSSRKPSKPFTHKDTLSSKRSGLRKKFQSVNKVVLIFFSSLWMIKPQCATLQITAVEQYFHKVLFIMLYKGVLMSVDEVLVRDHSNESQRDVLSCGTVYYLVQGGFYLRQWIKPKV